MLLSTILKRNDMIVGPELILDSRRYSAKHRLYSQINYLPTSQLMI